MKKKWDLIFKGKIEDFDNSCSLDYWKDKSTDEKFAEVTNLIKQAQIIKNNTDFDGSKFLRLTAVIRKP